MLDSASPVPLYYQLKEKIEENIASGLWLPGDRVPSEADLGAQYQVSRTTVRQALGALVNQGLLTRMQGKGTFVAQPRIQQSLSQLTGFTQDMTARGQKPSSRVLQFEVIFPTSRVAAQLQIDAAERVIALKRLRLSDGTPMAIETSHLICSIGEELLGEDLAVQSLYKLLSEKLNIYPSLAWQQMEAVACPPVEAGLLGIRSGSPVLHIHRTTFDQHGRPFEQVESYYRGDRYVFQVQLSAHR